MPGFLSGSFLFKQFLEKLEDFISNMLQLSQDVHWVLSTRIWCLLGLRNIKLSTGKFLHTPLTRGCHGNENNLVRWVVFRCRLSQCESASAVLMGNVPKFTWLRRNITDTEHRDVQEGSGESSK